MRFCAEEEVGIGMAPGRAFRVRDLLSPRMKSFFSKKKPARLGKGCEDKLFPGRPPSIRARARLEPITSSWICFLAAPAAEGSKESETHVN